MDQFPLDPRPESQAPVPLSHRSAPLTPEDLQRIERRIRPLEKMPRYLRAGAVGFLIAVTLFLFLTLRPGYFYVIFAAMAVPVYLVSEWALGHYLRLLKADVLKGEKHVWTGTLTEARYRSNRSSRSSGPHGYVWRVSGRDFRVEKGEFGLAEAGHTVEVEQLPESGLVLGLRRLT